MKLSVTIVLLSVASYAFAQGSDRDSRSTKIDENEKKRLENQFKALDNFYINEDGLVVYQTKSESTTHAPADTTRNNTSVSKAAKAENTNNMSKGAEAATTPSRSGVIRKEKSQKNEANTSSHVVSSTATEAVTTPSRPSVIRKEKSEKNEASIPSKTANNMSTPTEKTLSTPIVSSAGTEIVTAPQQKSGIIKKEALRPTEASTSNSDRGTSSEAGIQKTATKPATASNSAITNQQTKNNLVKASTPSPSTTSTTNIKLTSPDSNKTGKTTSTALKGSIFDKSRQPAQYRTMEEAALAVEALLDDLRKKQTQTSGAGSMSSRLAGGAGRATLRKKSATNSSFQDATDYTSENSSTTIVDESASEFGSEPTYYINGKEVGKTEINKLRKKEIISREVRTRNTVSGNPNGEVWYEVKYDTAN